MQKRIVSGLIGALVSIGVSAADPSQKTLSVDLKPGGLLACLEQLALSAGVRIVDTTDRAVTASCAGTRGQLSLEQALQRVLEPAGLTWRQRDDGTIEIIATQRLRLDLKALTIEGAPVIETAPQIAPAITELVERAGNVTRIERDWLESAPLLGMNQLARYAPNLYGSGQSLAIRGVEREDRFFTALSVFLDGIDLGTQLLDDELVPIDDLIRIDLARGPRTFESGGASTAGAIRLYTPAPADQAQRTVAVGWGNQGAQRYAAAWSGPLTQNGIGASVTLERRMLPDFVNQRGVPSADVDQRRQDSGRLKLSVAPAAIPELSAELALLSVSGDTSDRWIVRQSPTSTPLPAGERDSYAAAVEHARTRANGASLRADYARDDWHAELHFSGTRAERDGVELPLRASRSSALEVRQRLGASVRRDWNERWSLVAGMEGARVETPRTTQSYIADTRIRSEQLTDLSTRTRSTWMWLEHHWNVDWTAGIGLRSVREQATTRNDVLRCRVTNGASTDSCAGQTILSEVHQIGVVDTSDPIPMGVIEWHPHPDQVLMLSRGRGYRSGGSLTPDRSYEPERQQSTELIWRAAWNDARLHSVVTLFDTRVRDRYTFPQDVNADPNRGRVHIRGLELELQAQLAERWRVRGGIGLLNARYLEFVYNDDQDLAGKPLPGAPSRTAILGLRYGETDGWYGAFDAYHAAAAETGPINAPTVARRPYSLLDLRVGHRTDRRDTALVVTNATDSTYVDRATLQGGLRYRLGDPRRVEIRSQWTW